MLHETIFFFFTYFQVEFVGQTGLIRIDKYGDRSDFELVFKKVDENGPLMVGTWSPGEGLLLKHGNVHLHGSGKKGLGSTLSKPLTITTVLVSV